MRSRRQTAARHSFALQLSRRTASQSVTPNPCLSIHSARSTNAVRSCALSSPSAAWTDSEIWLLYSSRSGPGAGAGMECRIS